MKKLIALGSLLGLPTILSVGHALPGIVTILLFSQGPAGVFQTLGILTTASAWFSYFVSGFFPTTGGISNFIIGL